MALSPEEIERREFSSSLRGFDKSEVRDFLRRVAREVGRLHADLSRTDLSSSKLPTSDQSAFPASPVGVPQPAASAKDFSATQTDPVNQPDAPEAPEPAQPGAVEPEAAPQPFSQPSLDTDDDRFEALGERIAGLLRTAHTSAAQLKENAESEAAATIKAAHDEAEAIRRQNEDEMQVLYAEAERAAESTRAIAATDADRVRAEAEAEGQAIADEASRILTEAEAMLAQAQADAAQYKEQAIADGERELADRVAEMDLNTQTAQADREAAMEELANAREQVAALLGEARSQSDFIRHEAEEIIRARIRANVDQAEQRLTMLRNSEVASRERIARAHEELTGALARLDSEASPALPSNPENAVLEEAYERGEASQFGESELPPLATTAAPIGSNPQPEDDDRSASDDPHEIIEISEVFGSKAEAPSDEADETYESDEAGDESDVVSDEADVVSNEADVVSNEADEVGDELPDDSYDDDLPPLEIPENEDALARLVREAMQRAVDSARGSDN